MDEVTREHAGLCRGEIGLQLASTTTTVERLHALAQSGIELFAAHDDDQALLRACWVSYLTSMTIGRSTAAREAIDRLGVLADRLSHPLAGRLPGMRAMNLAWGLTPVPDALEATDALLRTVRDDPATEPFVLAGHAYLLAQAGDIASARAALDRMRAIAERQGQRIVLWASWGQNVGRTALLAGDPERAERALRPSFEALRDAGSLAFSSTLAGQLGTRSSSSGAPTRRRRSPRSRATRRARPTSCRRFSGGARCHARSTAGRRGAIAEGRRRGRPSGRDDRVAERPRRHAPRPGARGNTRR